MKKTQGVVRQRDNQPYLVIPSGIAAWLVPGATLDLTVEDGRLVMSLVRGADRPKKPKVPPTRRPFLTRRRDARPA
jgi:hypothetical protein